MNEIWKDIEGFEGCYQISNLGRIKSLKRTVNGRSNKPTRIVKEKILALHKSPCGYLFTTLSKEAVHSIKNIHSAVAFAFIPNPENKKTVNHKDGNKLNNHVDNLEWNTCEENNRHASFNKLKMKKTINIGGVISDRIIYLYNKDLSINKTFPYISDAAREFGINRRTLSALLYRKQEIEVAEGLYLTIKKRA